MARIQLPITSVTLAGTNQPSATSGNTSENHYIGENDGLVVIEALNEDAAATHTVTVVASKEESGGLKVENETVTLSKKGEAGAIKLIGPLPPAVVNQANGQVYVNVSSNEVKFRVYHV